MLKRITESELFKDVRQIISFMKKSGVRLKFFATSLILSLLLTLFSLYTVTLLFPLVQGIIAGNFNNVKSLHILGRIVFYYPQLFSSSLRLFLLLVFWIYFTIIIKNIFQYCAFLSTQYQAKNATTKLRQVLFDKCLSFGKEFYDRNKLVYVHKILTQSTGVIEDQFELLQDFIIQIFLLLMYVTIMSFISWKLTVISIVTFPIIYLITKKIIRKIRDSLKEYEETLERLNAQVYMLLYCLPLVKGFTQEDRERAIFLKMSNEELEQSYHAQKLSSLIDPIDDIGSTTSTLLIALGMAVIIFLDHSIDASGALVFFYIAQKMVPCLNSINDFSLGMAKSKKKVEDINNILEHNDQFIVQSGGKEFGGLRSSIEVRDLSFSYGRSGSSTQAGSMQIRSSSAQHDAQTHVLEHLSLTIPKGKMTAIVGPTGSGKSTIANLLLRFYDCPAGTIFFDGVDIREYAVESLRKKMSFAAQDVLLFDTTLRHNMTYGVDGNADEKTLHDMGKKTAVHDFAQKLPGGYHAKVEERGANFSGGEKQRISLARAFLRDADIVILDEATSALDAKTEAHIVESMDALRGGTHGTKKDAKTFIVISHRLSTIKKADHIVYIEKGSVKESGTLDELITLQGEFYKQWMMQKI